MPSKSSANIWTSTSSGSGRSPKSSPTNPCSAYTEILTAYRTAHDQTLVLLDTLNDNDLDRSMVPDYLKDFPDFQAIGNLPVFIPMHDMSHRGQFVDVRQVLGRKPFA